MDVGFSQEFDFFPDSLIDVIMKDEGSENDEKMDIASPNYHLFSSHEVDQILETNLPNIFFPSQREEPMEFSPYSPCALPYYSESSLNYYTPQRSNTENIFSPDSLMNVDEQEFHLNDLDQYFINTYHSYASPKHPQRKPHVLRRSKFAPKDLFGQVPKQRRCLVSDFMESESSVPVRGAYERKITPVKAKRLQKERPSLKVRFNMIAGKEEKVRKITTSPQNIWEKRSMHNILERQRRIELKQLFEILKNSIPSLEFEERVPKILILNKATELCKFFNKQSESWTHLKKHNQYLTARYEKLISGQF